MILVEKFSVNKASVQIFQINYDSEFEDLLIEFPAGGEEKNKRPLLTGWIKIRY